VTETFGGKGAVADDRWWGMGGLGLEGNPAANALAADADVVLHIGTRLTDFATASQSIFRNPEVRFASVNVVGKDARKQGALAIEGDARLALAELLEAARRSGAAPRPEWTAQARAGKAAWLTTRSDALRGSDDQTMTQGALIGILNELARPGDTIIAASGGPPGDLQKVWDATGERHCHLEFGFSCMGYEVPAALGVRLAKPEGEVISLVGDGAYLMAPSELATAVQEGLKVTIVISDNHGFQVIRRLQMNVTGHHFGNELRRRVGAIGEGALEGDYLELDLGAVASGLGARALSASTPDELRHALAQAREGTQATVIVVPTAPHTFLPPSGVWWDVAPAQVSGEPSIAAKRAAYEEGLANQRWFG
jgi:3D-(3,5/4)-trihydroxycyclohexane-1,2-dione acylhydrolase (decyclizing)